MIRIGTSGWSYPHWREVFYPSDLPAAEWFAYYARHFDTVEINNTFYQLPAAETFRMWRAQAPASFVFAVKANRYLTHMKKLKDAAAPLERFLERARLLGDTLGPILYQLPPRWRCNLERLAQFIDLLPPELCHVFEFRDESWFCEATFALLKERGMNFCIFDMPDFPCPRQVTGPVVYVRFHGTAERYGGCYSREMLKPWADAIRGWQRAGHRVFAYFNNDVSGYAVQNAKELRELINAGAGM